jgi:ribonuclease BN (tRNA processing enzyme)
MNTDGIDIWVLGDFGPFSRMGKSIGYLVTIGQSQFLIDCGSPLFSMIGGHGLKDIAGLIITHCHDDHKRWFSDLALFHRYAPDFNKKLFLLASEDVYDELVKSATTALDRSLSEDSKSIIDIPFDEYVDYQMIGPKAKFKLVTRDLGNGQSQIEVVDNKGNNVGPDKAKIIISDQTGRPRILFKDPDYNEWIEPECFYPYSSEVFYEKDKGHFKGNGFVIEALKAPVWHGIPGIGIRITTDKETVIFTSDTVHDLELWKQLCTEKRTQKMNISQKEFDSTQIIYGNINDYIERIWSEDRYKEATRTFNDDAVVVQDVSARKSIVHTDYVRLKHTMLQKDRAILTHCPDRITSEWVLCYSDKIFKIKGNKFYEVVDGKVYPMNADIYHKEEGKYYVGYRNENGKYQAYDHNGLLQLPLNGEEEGYDPGKPVFKVDVYEDISGKYFPILVDLHSMYFERSDGKVEIIKFNEKGSSGKVVENYRDKLLEKD